MVTLDADFALTAATGAADALRSVGVSVEEFSHSINAILPGRRHRIQITVNSHYRAFPSRAVHATLFGVQIPIASLADVVQGKLWVATDPTRRASKRMKDTAALLRAEIPINVLAGDGRFLGSFLPLPNTHAQTRLRQYQRTLDLAFTLDLAVRIVAAKLYNQRRGLAITSA